MKFYAGIPDFSALFNKIIKRNLSLLKADYKPKALFTKCTLPKAMRLEY
ncbi:hypothetical protein HMPREF1568_3665 [Providencia alcalifaciens PAL-3]|nr:hypothetical protein HMPREF1568_3665 [Providencia alcalifaciens PAL-3]EUC99165.1 hypothetical protein HMPREF1566_3846 [Providencia alcalifaciens PAL-1]UNJ79645.1 hypothetical protein [Providencia sp.]